MYCGIVRIYFYFQRRRNRCKDLSREMMMNVDFSKAVRFYCFLCFVVFCIAESNITIDQDETNILEERLTSNEELTHKEVILIKGDSLKLECEFSPSPQSWSYVQWLKFNKEGQQLKHVIINANQTFNNGSIVISSIVLPRVGGSDSANYSCILTSAGDTSSMEFHVAVKDEASCNTTQCKPYGRCIELLRGYECHCVAGYIGQECQLIDPCFDNPCLNYGSCTITDNGFSCSCITGYRGKICEKKACLESSCNEGGSCWEKSDGSIKCNCEYNRAGEYCQHTCTFSAYEYRYGHYRRCRGGNTCVIDIYGDESCKCEDRIHGNHCMMLIDVRNECADPDICNRRGTCYDQTYGYVCSCNRHASGKNCQYFDECSSNSYACQYGGRCIDSPNGYKCADCPDGQTGDKCQYNENPCTFSCSESSMEVRCDIRFLNSKLGEVPIYLNSKSSACMLVVEKYSSSRRGRYEKVHTGAKSFKYTDCGTITKYEENEIVYRNSLQVGAFDIKDDNNDVITRSSGNFKVDMECRIPIIYNDTSAVIENYSLEKNESKHLSGKKTVRMLTEVSFNNYDWQPITKYSVGNRLFIDLYFRDTISNQMMLTFGVLKPITCYATPDKQGLGSRYTLMEDGCIKDKTFRFEKRLSEERDPNNVHAYFSFDSFSFKDQGGKMALHCNAQLCLNETVTKEDFGFEKCENMCEEHKVKLDESQVTTSSPIESTSYPGVTNSTTSQNDDGSILTRIKRAIIRSDYGKDEDIIERNSGDVVDLYDA